MMATTELQDRLEIADLINRLGACLDEHRFEEIAEVIADDATASTPAGEAEGRVAVIAQATRNHHDFDHLQHVITNVLIDLDGDQASARANLHGTFIDASGRVALELGAVYRFQAKRTPDGWRLARIEVSPLWRRNAA